MKRTIRVGIVQQSCTNDIKLNLEMAATDEMIDIACRIKPEMAMLVPEGRHEITTEGGLDILAQEKRLKGAILRLADCGIVSSVFIDADPVQIEAAGRIGARVCEIHTGPYAHAFHDFGRDAESPEVFRELEKIRIAGEKVRALYQGDTIVFSLSGLTPAATYPTRKGEVRCYRSGAAAVVQCTTGFGPEGASMLVLQNQNEDYLLGLSVSASDWPDHQGRPTAPLQFRAGENAPVTVDWVNQSLSDAQDVSAWTAIFEGKAYTDALLQQKGPVPIEIETRLANDQPVKQAFDFAEMIALYRAMAALTREMPVR